ncbi:rSAM-modified peptide [Flavobacterium hungaricum]|uniref:RSAM-modified peptide n=1 Tax=Flavobacterium hungaricum TaxID=2082725 RepID=A0ABR9TKE7_9FLAO|nr:rSAM-modified peptide [Flavobacterium hungaricum]MBE8725137.1 rSAM-modified peptide [Flavobacterium hungaricum]
MKNSDIKFSDFESQQMTKEQQKAVRGGDGETPPVDPKNGGGGSGNG